MFFSFVNGPLAVLAFAAKTNFQKPKQLSSDHETHIESVGKKKKIQCHRLNVLFHPLRCMNVWSSQCEIWKAAKETTDPFIRQAERRMTLQKRSKTFRIRSHRLANNALSQTSVSQEWSDKVCLSTGWLMQLLSSSDFVSLLHHVAAAAAAAS